MERDACEEATVHITFLTRRGCANSPLLRARLAEAMRSLELDATLEVADLATLAATDHRTGYGTPTILVEGEDLFGAPRPLPATPA
jgi:hypothetical protein